MNNKKASNILSATTNKRYKTRDESTMSYLCIILIIALFIMLLYVTTSLSSWVRCAECGLMLSNVYCLRKHVQRHHVTRDQHKCGECGQSFIKQQHLQKHSYEHTGILPFL